MVRTIYMRKYYTTLLLLILVGMVQPCFSQSDDPELDSLYAALEAANADSVRLTLHYDIGHSLFYRDLARTMTHGHQVIKLGRKLEDEWYIGEGYIMLGWAHLELAQWDSCRSYIRKLIDESERVGNLKLKCEAYRIEGVIHSQRGNQGKSIASNEKALEVSKELGDNDLIAATYNNIAMQFHFQDDTVNALKYYDLATEFYLKTEEGGHRLSNILSNKSNLVRDTSLRIALIDSAIAINLEAKEYDLVGTRLAAKSSLYYDMNMAGQTYRYAKEAYKYLINSTSGDRYDAFRTMAKAYLITEKYDSAIIMADSALAGYEDAAFPDLTNALYKVKAVAHSKLGDYKKAYFFADKSLLLGDSIYSDRNKEMIEEFNARYENEEKEQQLAQQRLKIELDRKNRNFIILGAIALLIGMTMLFLLYYSRQKRKKAMAEMALEVERKEKATLQELDGLKSQFFTNISHELKTPLTLITGPLGEAVENIDSEGQLKDTIKMAERNSKKLLDLVNEILQLAKLESNQLPVRPKPVHLDEFLRRLFTSFDSYAQTQGLQLKIESNLGGEAIVVDTDHLERIMTNLISNATKYTPSGGVVTLEVGGERIDDQLSAKITISDTGPGIPEHQIHHIFDRFYQTPEVRGQEKGGVGVGLSLAAQLSELIGGRLSCVSEVGVGSSFTLELTAPLTTIETQQPEDEVVYSANFEALKDKTVLVVEDNLDMQQYLKSLLESNFNVVQALDGYQALKLLQTEHIDLVMSDIMMPKMDGYRLREQMLKIENIKRLPFLFLSARSLEEDIMHGFALGIDDYITKPFNAKSLMARIENLMVNSMERQRHAAQEGVLEERELSQLEHFEALLRENIPNAKAKVADLAVVMGVSERQLRRISKSATGMSPVELMLEMRLLKARNLLESQKFATVAEVMYQVGMESASYFSKKFTRRFGLRPSELIK